MSAEGKKRRGETGKRNAETSPYRLNGWAPDWRARQIGVYQVTGSASSGAKQYRAIEFGYMLQSLGLGQVGGSEAIYDRILSHAERRISLTTKEREVA